jgi:hypothetical protein
MMVPATAEPRAACRPSCTGGPAPFHGSLAILSAEVSQRQSAELYAALRRAPAE